MTKILTFHVEYGSQGEHLWRDIEVSEKYGLHKLGFAIMATFDTMAYHLFGFNIRDVEFSMPMDGYLGEEWFNMSKFKLSDMQFKVGDAFVMEYDMGESQIFNITVTKIADMPKGTGRAYPRIIDGKGVGMIDDMSESDFAELVRQIHENGKTDERIYYKDRQLPWNIDSYDIKIDNALLKSEINMIEDGYFDEWYED